MKTKYTIFYSWISDRPLSQNYKYIRNVLIKESKKIEKELGITIHIDSDSRNSDGDETIDATILKKIAACDLFVCDATPVRRLLLSMNNKTQEKQIPNPNAMYELGYAVASLGWNRCVLVWNEKYGDVGKAPFDIRNHLTISYHVRRHPLSFTNVLKEKIERFDELVKEWRLSKERSFDAQQYVAISDICPERELLDSIRHFLTNRVYSRLTFRKWNDLTSMYKAYPDTHFVDEELHQHYSLFLEALDRLETFAVTYNEPLHTNKDLDPDSEGWESEYMYILKKPFDYIPDENEAFKVQNKMEEEIAEIGATVLQTYSSFRNLIRTKLLI